MSASGSYAPPKGVLFIEPRNKPLVNGVVQPLAQRFFWYTGSSTIQMPVYKDGYLQTPFTQPIVADTAGRFPPIYLDPSIPYHAQLFSSTNVLLEDVDTANAQPIGPALSVVTTPLTITANSPVTVLSWPNAQPGVFYSYEAYVELQYNSGTVSKLLSLGKIGGVNTASATRYYSIIKGSGLPAQGTLNGVLVFTIAGSGVTGLLLRGSFQATGPGLLSLQLNNQGGAGSFQVNSGSWLRVQPLINQGLLFQEPQNKPLSTTGAVQPGSYRQFFYTTTTVPAIVYTDAGLQRQISQIIGQRPPSCTADGNGRFSPIYMDPSVIYRAQLYGPTGTLLEDIDPYVPKPFEIQSTVKLAPTVRLAGGAQAPDPGLQLTLNPGTYALETLLEFISNGTGLSVTLQVAQVSGSGTIVTTNTAQSLIYESNASGAASGQMNLSTNLTLNLATAPATYTTFLARGSITVSGASIVVGVSWSVGGGAGNQVAITSGSYIDAEPVG